MNRQSDEMTDQDRATFGLQTILEERLAEAARGEVSAKSMAEIAEEAIRPDHAKAQKPKYGKA